MRVPDWWTDIQRARLDALDLYSRVLDGIERTLDAPADLSSDARFRSVELWTALLQQERAASKRLASVLKLSDSRRHDAFRSGLHAPFDDNTVSDLARNSAERSRRLASRIRNKMDALRTDLSPQNARRPVTRSFRDSKSSQINLHA